ncbi:centrosomal protein of 83 kDa isoform X2 [Colletes gigas]|uniref:centrosomal protein of 83 kDa isoform X2 n=1 Tax=Colletes gigas TaxID=935657 RepID=UPI001C9B4235|nr:centrosomal protein of 83 kDa isoform X2 [Colletes gigas]
MLSLGELEIWRKLHMPEDMDALDMELLNNSFKKSKSSTSIFKDSNLQLVGGMKKKVIFEDANEDDLSTVDLLSDEEISLKEKKNVFATGSKSNLMEDLFKIKTPVTSATSIKLNNELESKFHFEHEDVYRSFSQKPSSDLATTTTSVLLKRESSIEKHVQEQKTVSVNDEDILAKLIDKSDAVNDKSRRSGLRENLFENKPLSSATMDLIIPKNTKKAESEVSIKTAEFPNTAQKSKSQPVDRLPKLSTGESRRGRRNTKIINDPLGLLPTDLLSDQNFQLLTGENVSTNKDTNPKLEENLPEWLGGTKKVEEKKQDEIHEGIPLKDRLSDKVGKESASNENIKSQDIKNSTDAATTGVSDSEAVSVPEHFSLLFGTQFNQRAAIMTMQQQEHELRTATVLSQQNEQLSKVSDAQRSILCNQEKQFNSFLKLQLEKQLLLEKQIKMQQERINRYMQTLMAQPISVSSTTSVYTTCKSEESEKCLAHEKEEMESTIKMLQIDISKLESTLSAINGKHNNEVAYQAEFYERQISFLKEAMLKLEERMKQEVEFLEADYMVKLEKLRNEKLQIENLCKEEIHNLKNEHAQRIEECNKLHLQHIKHIHSEYSNIIESICKAKETENQIIETVTSRKFDIEDMLERANIIIESMQKNKEKIEVKSNEIMERRENYLKTYEEDMKAQQFDLKNQNSVLEEHRNKFVEMTEKFSTRLTRFVTELEKQITQNNQSQELFENRAANLLRERELFEEKVKWERDYLQTLKESWMKEQERQLKLLAEERETVAAEKAQLDILSRLKTNSGNVGKIELEAAIKTTQEVTACANQEKLKWREKINELDARKQILQDKENLLILRAKELEDLTRLTLIKKEEATKALKDAKYLERQHKERLGLLHMQFKRITERERKVRNETYDVAKGMISASCETEKPERDINVPHNFHSGVLPFSVMHSTSKITSELMIVDPNLIMLKLNLDDNYDTIT